MATKKKNPIKAGDIVWAMHENRAVEFRVESMVTTIRQDWRISEISKSETHHQTETSNYHVRKLSRSRCKNNESVIPAVGTQYVLPAHEIFRTKQDLLNSL